MIGQTISHYRIIKKLGEGGMGVVYVAEDILLGRQVAIKTLSTTAAPGKQHFRKRFLREARAISTLSHPHIATIYDYGETEDGQPYIVMELINGKNLSDILEESAFTLLRAVEIISDIAKALSEAHSHGIIHRDIKPSNVAINERGEIKVLDFGLAKQVNDEGMPVLDPEAQSLVNTQTREGVVVGTPMYLSPEQALGASVDIRSDLFSLGTLLYECIAGKPAFSGLSPIEICAQVIRDDPPPPSHFNPHVPPKLDRITLKALAKKADARYQSAKELLADLQAIHSELLSAESSRSRRVSHRASTLLGSAFSKLNIKSPRSNVLLRAFLLLLVLTSLIFGAIWLLRGKTPPLPAPETKRLYDLGVNAIRNGTYHKASKILTEALKQDEQYALVHASLAEAWSELDYMDKAKDEIILTNELVQDRSKLLPLDALRVEATIAVVRRDFAKAEENYRSLAQQVPDAEKPFAYLDLGRAYEKDEKLEQAIESYLEAAKRDPHYAAAFLRLGVAYGRHGDFALAEAAFNEAYRLYQIPNDIEGLTEVLYQRGLLLNSMDKLAEARKQLQQALEMTRATDSKPQRIKTLLQLSSVALSERDLTQAQLAANEAITLARTDKLENLTTNGLIDIGNTFFMLGEYDKAEDYFKQALQIAQLNKGLRGEARALLSLGSLCIQQVKPDQGLPYLKQALDFYERGGYRKETSQALILLGRTNSLRGDYDAALQAFEQQLRLANQGPDRAQVASAHTSIGNLLVRREQYLEALRQFDQSYAINQSLQAQSNIGYNLMNRANALWQLGRYDEAQVALQKAYAIASDPSGSYKHLLSWIHLINSQIELTGLRFREAQAQSRQALDLANNKYPEVTVQAKLVLGLARVLSGAKQSGLQLCKEAVEIATQSGDPWLISKAQLLHARALLESGDAEGASAIARQTQGGFARTGQQDSEWQAWFIASRASQHAGDAVKAQEYAAHARDLLLNLKEKWGGEAYQSYLARPDVLASLKQLNAVLQLNSETRTNLREE